MERDIGLAWQHGAACIAFLSNLIVSVCLIERLGPITSESVTCAHLVSEPSIRANTCQASRRNMWYSLRTSCLIKAHGRHKRPRGGAFFSRGQSVEVHWVPLLQDTDSAIDAIRHRLYCAPLSDSHRYAPRIADSTLRTSLP
jgi:hypothetical protein